MGITHLNIQRFKIIMQNFKICTFLIFKVGNYYFCMPPSVVVCPLSPFVFVVCCCWLCCLYGQLEGRVTQLQKKGKFMSARQFSSLLFKTHVFVVCLCQELLGLCFVFIFLIHRSFSVCFCPRSTPLHAFTIYLRGSRFTT